MVGKDEYVVVDEDGVVDEGAVGDKDMAVEECSKGKWRWKTTG